MTISMPPCVTGHFSVFNNHIIFICLYFFAIQMGSAAFAQNEGTTHIHGFISQGYLKTTNNDYMADTEDGTFQYNEMGINFSLPISSKLRMGTQLFARDLGNFGNDEIVVDWAFGEYRVNEFFGLRGGKYKISHGLYNEVRDVDAVRSSVLLPRSIYLEPLRDVFVAMKGINIFGRSPFGLSYTVGYGIMDIKDDSDISNVIYTLFTNALCAEVGDISGSVESLDIDYLFNAGLQWEAPIDGLKASFTIYGTELTEMIDYGFLAKAVFRPMVYTLSFAYSTYGTTIAIESMLIHADIELNINDFGISEKDSQDLGGGYVSIAQRITDILEIGVYYSIFYEDLDDRDGKNYEKIGEKAHIAWEKDACISFRLDIDDNWIAKIEGHLINGTNMIDNRVRTGDLHEEFMLLAMKVSYSF